MARLVQHVHCCDFNKLCKYHAIQGIIEIHATGIRCQNSFSLSNLVINFV
jgi:hypothetical protein